MFKITSRLSSKHNIILVHYIGTINILENLWPYFIAIYFIILYVHSTISYGSAICFSINYRIFVFSFHSHNVKNILRAVYIFMIAIILVINCTVFSCDVELMYSNVEKEIRYMTLSLFNPFILYPHISFIGGPIYTGIKNYFT